MIIDKYGYVVPPKDPNLLSTVIQEVIRGKYKRLENAKSREHIKSNYSIERNGYSCL